MVKLVTLINDQFAALRAPAEKVVDFEREAREIYRDLRLALAANPGLGLAAPQIGVARQMFVAQPAEGLIEVFINPEIIARSVAVERLEEGCLSIPGVFAAIERPRKITVKYQDLEGRRLQKNARGMLARIIQHEHDHLRGVLFVDYLSQERRRQALKALKLKVS